jgi:hypothetical protein
MPSTEAAEPPQAEPPRRPVYTVSVGPDAAAKMPTAESFRVEERHVSASLLS